MDAPGAQEDRWLFPCPPPQTGFWTSGEGDQGEGDSQTSHSLFSSGKRGSADPIALLRPSALPSSSSRLPPPTFISLPYPVCEVGALLVRRLVIRFIRCACGESIASQFIRKTRQVTVLSASRKPNPERHALCFVALFACSPSGASGLQGEKHRIEEFLIMRIHFKVCACWPLGPYVEHMG